MTEQEKEEEEEIETIGAEKPPIVVSAIGYGVPVSKEGKKAGHFVVAFYFSPPEYKKHVHSVIARIALEWEEGEDFAKRLLEFIRENKPTS